jgi:hypothetical protein
MCVIHPWFQLYIIRIERRNIMNTFLVLMVVFDQIGMYCLLLFGLDRIVHHHIAVIISTILSTGGAMAILYRLHSVYHLFE